MHSANEVANWFLAWADVNDAEISNLKMQKLLYYAQAHHLGSSGRRLFEDEVQAWAHGPVVPSTYHRFKKYGNGAINSAEEIPESFDWDDFTEENDFLVAVWNTYGSQEAWALRNRTHREAPWMDAFNTGARNCEITPDAMRDFFAHA
jgi:uncharacterized phage-associated protein